MSSSPNWRPTGAHPAICSSFAASLGYASRRSFGLERERRTATQPIFELGDRDELQSTAPNPAQLRSDVFIEEAVGCSRRLRPPLSASERGELDDRVQTSGFHSDGPRFLFHARAREYQILRSRAQYGSGHGIDHPTPQKPARAASGRHDLMGEITAQRQARVKARAEHVPIR
jgi:hypothetical protein